MHKRRHILKVAIGVAVVQVALVTFLYQQELLVTILLAVSALALLWYMSFSRIAWISFLVFAASGFIAEAIVVTGGAWVYDTQHVFGLPIWLPLLWGGVGLASVRLTEKLQQRYGRK